MAEGGEDNGLDDLGPGDLGLEATFDHDSSSSTSFSASGVESGPESPAHSASHEQYVQFKSSAKRALIRSILSHFSKTEPSKKHFENLLERHK